MSDPSTPTPGEQVTRTDVDRVLESVYDPELDRSLTELRYVERVEIEEGRVTVVLRLPTGLCAPAFAWMMASDVREAVRDLPGATAVAVRLVDHVHQKEINDGVNAGKSFTDVFEGEPGEMMALRRKLDHKARLRRQHTAVDTLLDAGMEPGTIVSLTLGDLEIVGDRAIISVGRGTITVPAQPFEVLLDKLEDVGIPVGPGEPLMRSPDGGGISADEFQSVRRLTSLARVNMAGQAHYCGALLAERYGLEEV